MPRYHIHQHHHHYHGIGFDAGLDYYDDIQVFGQHHYHYMRPIYGPTHGIVIDRHRGRFRKYKYINIY